MTRQKYVARAEKGTGWRIFNRNTQRYWGNFFPQYPEDVLKELNSDANPEKLVELCRISKPKKNKK